MVAAAKFYLSLSFDPAIRLVTPAGSYVGYLAHDELSGQDSLGWLYDAPSDDLAQLALDCLLDRGEHATVSAYGLVAEYQGNESEQAMAAAVEAEIAEREPSDDDMQAERERIYDGNARTEAARGAW